MLTLDIETSPMQVYAWGLFEENAINQKVLKRSTILCVSYKWLHEKKVHNIAQIDDPKYKPGVENDRYVMEKLRDLLNEADIVVTQNGKKFDIPIIRTRMIMNGIAPFSPFKHVDTKQLARTLFKFESSSLKYTTRALDITQKSDPGGFGTWEGCMAGDKKAWRAMIKYNNIDVIATEELYIKMRPYMENHPSLSVISGRKECCDTCGNTQLQARGWGYNKKTKYRRYQCVGRNGCGAWNKGDLIKR